MAGFDAVLYATAFEEVVGQAKKVEQLNQPGWYGPEVEVLDEMGKVRFFVMWAYLEAAAIRCAYIL